MAEPTRLRIRRYDPETGRRWTQEYTLDAHPGMTVLEALWHIVRHVDGSLSFRYSCRGAVCGSCAMVIDGTITLACHTQVSALGPGPIEIEPMPRMKVLKDLVVDMEPFLQKFQSIEPWLKNTRTHERELLQSAEARTGVRDAVKCILCGSCHSACPLTALDPDYLGPATLSAAQRFVFDDRHEERDGMLDRVNHGEAAFGCRTISRCTEVCPKGVAPSLRIKELKARIRERAGAGGADGTAAPVPEGSAS